MGEGPEKKGRWAAFMAFWSTLPGVLTAAAALITAVLALFAAVGVLRPTPSPTPDPTTAVILTAQPSSAPPTNWPKAKPKPTPRIAKLAIKDLVVKTDAGYPVIDMLVGNTGTIKGTVTRLLLVAEEPPHCANDGGQLPQVDYDILLPKLQGEDLAAPLPERKDIEPGGEASILLSLGIKRAFYDRCTINASIAIRFVDADGARESTLPWDEPVPLTIRPLEKSRIECRFPGCVDVLPSISVTQP